MKKRKDFYIVRFKAQSHSEIINAHGMGESKLGMERMGESKLDMERMSLEAESNNDNSIIEDDLETHGKDSIKDEEKEVPNNEMTKDIYGEDMEIPQANADKDNDKDDEENVMEMCEKDMKKDVVDSPDSKLIENDQENGMEIRVKELEHQGATHQKLTDADGEQEEKEQEKEQEKEHINDKANREKEKLVKYMLIRKGRIAVLDLINEKKLNLHYAPYFLQQLVARTQGTTPDQAQHLLQKMIEEQKKNLNLNEDKKSVMKWINRKMPMNKKTMIQMWIKEYKQRHPLTLLSDSDLKHLATGETIFPEMTDDQMEQYNADEGQRLESSLFLYRPIATGVLLALCCLMVSSTLDVLFG